MVIEQNITAMLMTPTRFADFVEGEIADAAEDHRGAARPLRREPRGRRPAARPRRWRTAASEWKPNQDHGFMYGASFADPDGHVWEVVWMDPAAVAG